MYRVIKTTLFNIMDKVLGWNVCDNLESVRKTRHFPQVYLQTAGISKDFLTDTFKHNYRIQIHIFSKYDGEKEILDMEEALINNLMSLYDIDGVIYIKESGFNIVADKSTGVEMKHGIITLSIDCAGQFKEEDQENEESTG